ncbi:hypothetical protein BHE74_00047620 [Ensete ventricosum]|nr:hypothetical protein BHE74_00047620 [Ensete ventricosum]
MTRLVHRLLFNLLLPVLASAVSLDLLFTYGRSERRSARRGAGPGDLGRPHGPQPRLLRPRTSAASTSPRTVPGPTTAGSATTSRSPYRLYATVDGCDQSKATAVPTHHRLVVGDGCPKPSSSFS